MDSKHTTETVGGGQTQMQTKSRFNPYIQIANLCMRCVRLIFSRLGHGTLNPPAPSCSASCNFPLSYASRTVLATCAPLQKNSFSVGWGMERLWLAHIRLQCFCGAEKQSTSSHPPCLATNLVVNSRGNKGSQEVSRYPRHFEAALGGEGCSCNSSKQNRSMVSQTDDSAADMTTYHFTNAPRAGWGLSLSSPPAQNRRRQRRRPRKRTESPGEGRQDTP